jgi:hypothetical protein
MVAVALRAADSPDLVYKFHLLKPAAKVEWTSASVGNWDVTVTVDPAQCELSCAYRLKRNSPAAHLLAPPAVVVRVYSDLVSIPRTVTFDPAGLNLPAAARRVPLSRDSPYMPGRRLLAAALPPTRGHLPPAPPQSHHSSASRAPVLPAAAAPLRI